MCGKNYSFSKQTKIDEKTKVSSKAEFFGVQFDECFYVDGKYTTLAFIDREAVFDVYYQRIRDAAAKIEGLLFTAEDFNNPLSGLEAAEEAARTKSASFLFSDEYTPDIVLIIAL